jgi:V/A-type H+-transporting ATPase subunit C
MGTKASALKGTLLGRSTIEKLAESTSLEELVNRLRGTPYANALPKLSPPYTARRLELAFRERLADVHFLLMTLAGKNDLLSLYYLKHIAWDLKSVLKSKALGRSSEEFVDYLDMHAEELVGRRELIVKVLSAKDVQEASSLLSGTEFSEDIASAIAAFTAKNEIRFFDLYIDHAVLSGIATTHSSEVELYSSSRAVDVAGIGDMVALDIDSYNILSILRAKLWGLSDAETRGLVVTPTYRATLPTLQRMIATESTAEAARLLEGIFPGTLQSTVSGEAIVDSVEDAFTAESIRTASKAFVWQGLGLANALAMIKLLEFEVRNLAAIAIGVEAHLATKAVLSKLLF